MMPASSQAEDFKEEKKFDRGRTRILKRKSTAYNTFFQIAFGWIRRRYEITSEALQLHPVSWTRHVTRRRNVACNSYSKRCIQLAVKTWHVTRIPDVACNSQSKRSM